MSKKIPHPTFLKAQKKRAIIYFPPPHVKTSPRQPFVLLEPPPPLRIQTQIQIPSNTHPPLPLPFFALTRLKKCGEPRSHPLPPLLCVFPSASLVVFPLLSISPFRCSPLPWYVPPLSLCLCKPCETERRMKRMRMRMRVLYASPAYLLTSTLLSTAISHLPFFFPFRTITPLLSNLPHRTKK